MNKAALKRLAVELRAEIDLGIHQPFDPYALAELYGIDVVQLSDVKCSAEALKHFRITRPDVFSGALVPVGDGGAVIIENDGHDPERRLSTASHEMAHVVMEHPFAAMLTDERKCRLLNKDHEAEAAELGGELLLPADAAKQLAFNGATDEQAARRFRVSIEIARWRMNSTGARKIAQRAHAKRRR